MHKKAGTLRPCLSNPRRYEQREAIRRPVNLDGLSNMLHEYIGGLLYICSADGPGLIGSNNAERE